LVGPNEWQDETFSTSQYLTQLEHRGYCYFMGSCASDQPHCVEQQREGRYYR
jgi:hypothetical protein